MILTHLIIVIVLCYHHVMCSKICDFDDAECLTAAAKRVDGFPSAPLHVDVIEANLPSVRYKLTNVTLFGIPSCTPELVKIHPKDMTYDCHLACSHLIMTGLYEVGGTLGSMPIEGKGDFKVDYDDYVFLFNGEFDQNTGKDSKLHNQIKNFKLNIDARGQVIYDLKNLFNGDNEKATALKQYVRENGTTVNKIMRQPVMERFMTLLIERVNTYLQKVPVEDLFTEA